MHLNPVALVVLVAACGSHTDPQAAPAKKEAAPAPVAAVEKITGNVLVEQSQKLYPTEAAARAHAKDPSVPTLPIALLVTADRGDVIELTTKQTDDCVDERREQRYVLTVFVARTALIPRAAATLTTTYPDGTAVMIERGAPARREPIAWRDKLLAATPVAPAALVLATPPEATPAELPAPTGEKLVCDRDRAPEPVSKWLARERKHPRTPPGPKYDSPFGDDKPSDAEVLSWARSCGVVPPVDETKAQAPQAGGRTLPWPHEPYRQDVFRTPAGLRADVGVQCGRVRMSAELATIGEHDGGASVDIGGRRQWTMRSGNVVWPDGSPAGTFKGPGGYFDRDVEVRGDLLCVAVEGIAEKVCHHRADADHV